MGLGVVAPSYGGCGARRGGTIVFDWAAAKVDPGGPPCLGVVAPSYGWGKRGGSGKPVGTVGKGKSIARLLVGMPCRRVAMKVTALHLHRVAVYASR